MSFSDKAAYFVRLAHSTRQLRFFFTGKNLPSAQRKSADQMPADSPACLKVGTSNASHDAHQQRHDEKHQEQEEKDLRNRGGCTCDTTKAQHAGDDCDNQKYQRIVKHIGLL